VLGHHNTKLIDSVESVVDGNHQVKMIDERHYDTVTNDA